MDSELLEIMIENGMIEKSAVEHLEQVIFHTLPKEGGYAPWDVFFNDEWNKETRDSFDSIVKFYTDDAHTIFQSSMSGSFAGCGINSKFSKYIKPGMMFMDYGSGGGREAFGAVKAGANVTICDVSKRMMDACVLLAGKNGYSIKSILIDQDVPSLPKEAFDFVVTIDCLEHVRCPVDVLHELVKSMKPGALMWNEVFFGGHDLSPYHLLETRHYGQGTEWVDILTNAGLVCIDDESTEGHLWKKL